MIDIDNIVDNILLSHVAAEDSKRARRSAIVNKAAVIIVPFLPFLIAAAIIAVGIIIASI